MGFFKKLKASVGIGGAKVKIELAPGAVAPGGYIRGTVVIKGGKLEQKCNGLEVGLERQIWVKKVVDGKEEETAQHDTIHSEDLAAYEMDINPGYETSREFTIQLPRDAEVGGRISYEVTAQADIPGAIDPKDSVKVPVSTQTEQTADDLPGMLEAARTLVNDSDRISELEQLTYKILDLEPGHPEALRLLAEGLGYTGRYSESAAIWKLYTERMPDDPSGWTERSRRAFDNEEYQEVVDCTEKSTELAPRNDHVWQLRAKALESLDRKEEALQAWEHSLDADYPNQHNYVDKARLLAEMGQQSAAIETYQAACQLEDQGAMDQIVEGLDKLGHPEIADECLESAVAAHPDDWSNIQIMAERKFEKNQLQECLEVTDRALQVADIPYFRSDLYFLKGRALKSLGDLDQARQVLEQAIAENEDNNQAQSLLKELT